MASRRFVAPSPHLSPQVSLSSVGTSWESFQKLFRSVDDLQTRTNHARHLALTKNILYESELGWKLVELPLVSDLLLLLRSKVRDGVPQFNDQLVVAIRRCCKPFIRQKANEEMTTPSLIQQLLGTLGQLLSFDDLDVQVAAVEALRAFSIGACLPREAPKLRNNHKANDLRLTPRIFSQNLMEETGTVDAIAAVMHDLFPDDGLEKEEDEYQFTENGYSSDPTDDSLNRDNQQEDEAIVDTLDPAEGLAMAVQILPCVQLRQPEERATSDCQETMTANSEHNDTRQDTKRPASAPLDGHADSFHRDGLQHYKSINSARATKSFSALSMLHRRVHDIGDVATIEPKQEDGPEQKNDSAQDDQQVDQSANHMEEEDTRMMDNSLPIEMRSSALLFPLIDLLCELSSYQRCAEVLVLSGTLHYVVFLLESITNPQDELLPLCLEILWNVLEQSHEKVSAVTKCASRKELLEVFRWRNASFFLSTEFTFQALLHVLELLLAQGYRQHDKERRNECLMILQLLAKTQRSLDFFYSTGLTACLFSYATSAELSHVKKPRNALNDKLSATASAITATSEHYASNSDEDFEFKRMLWFLLAEISRGHPANLRELVQFRFVETWLSYATVNVGSANDQQECSPSLRTCRPKYTTPQLRLLQELSLSVLNHVAPFIVEHFYEIGGHTKLLEFLRLQTAPNDVLASAWILMLQLSPALPSFQAELGELGVIETAMEVFEAPPSRHTFAIRRNAILVCASMCRNGEGANHKRFRLANGVYSLVQSLQFDPSHAIFEDDILVAILDAVRSCVVGDRESERVFINADGVSKLLSIVELVPKALKHQTLAALAEICVNPAAIPSYLAWRSDQSGSNNNASASQVLLRIYAEEEAAEKGVIQDFTGTSIAAVSLDDSMVSSTAQYGTFQSITPETTFQGDASILPPTNRPDSPAFARLKAALKAAQVVAPEKQDICSILDLQTGQTHPKVNLKAKIHAILANVSLAGDAEYLTPHDQMILEGVKEYATFKDGEMWQNVERALHAERIRPIYADALYIQTKIEHAYNVSVCTKLAQREVFERACQQTTEKENAFFEHILQQKYQEAQAEEFHRTNRRQNSTMQLHLDTKKTRLEFMRRQDPTAFAAYESKERCFIRDPPPEDVSTNERK